jgi:hypothetical protein
MDQLLQNNRQLTIHAVISIKWSFCDNPKTGVRITATALHLLATMKSISVGITSLLYAANVPP